MKSDTKRGSDIQRGNRCLIDIPLILKERNSGGEWKIFGAGHFY